MRWRAPVGLAAALALVAAERVGSLRAAAQDPVAPSALAIRITSPLGRTGGSGAVRIVAQVRVTPGVAAGPVRFFVDGVLLGEDAEGPPYAIEWADENPFEAREIAVEVTDATGATARDLLLLKPLEIIERAEVQSVVVEASVQNAAGAFVTGLADRDFTLTEDGVVQALEVVRPETLPATYTLLVDSSQSMSRRFDFVRDAAARLTGYLRPQDRIIVAPFTRTLAPVTGPTQDRETVVEAIAAIESAGGTAIMDAVAQISQVIRGVDGRQAVVLITDGYDEHSTQEVDTALRAIQQTGAALYVVGIGGVAGISMKGERFLRHLAAQTGGRAFFPSREIELETIHELVASDVQRRYLLTYTPKNQKADGTFRKISLTTSDTAFTVHARAGYFAPKPPPVRPSIEFTLSSRSQQYLETAIDDLRVFEDGVEQKLDVFQEASTPVSIVFALDTSGSMKRVVTDVKAAARAFVEAVRPEDKLALILFADRPVFAHDLTTVREWSFEAIEQYEAVGGTSLYDAMFDSLSRLRGVEGRRVIVLMTDGRDENNPGTGPGSVHTFDQALERLRQVEAAVFTIGLGTRIDREPLERAARESGGEVYFPQDVATLSADFQRILDTLRRRYVISYTSTNGTRDGRWRKVEIRSRKPNVAVSSRGGYFAPAR